MAATNPHLRAILIAGALAATAVALGMFTLSRQQADTSAAAPAPVPTRTTTTAPPVEREPVKVATPTPLPDASVRAALAAGLPKPVANAFAGRQVVVVTLYSPSSAVDTIARAEAAAGAALGGAGFVAVDASREGTAGKLVALVGVLTPPATLVFAQPEYKAVVRLKGFADRQTVAQAARNADPGGDTAQTPWATAANALCDRVVAQGRALAPSLAVDVKATLPRWQAVSDAFVAGLAKLEAPAGREADVARFLQLEKENVLLSQQLVAAAARGDRAAADVAVTKLTGVNRQVNALTLSLGASHCAGAV